MQLAPQSQTLVGELHRQHPQGLCTRTRVAGGLLIWPVPFHVEPSVGVAPTTSSVAGTCSDSLSYKGLHCCLAGTTRTCDPRLRRAVLSSTELRRDRRRRQGSNLQPP